MESIVLPTEQLPLTMMELFQPIILLVRNYLNYQYVIFNQIDFQWIFRSDHSYSTSVTVRNFKTFE